MKFTNHYNLLHANKKMNSEEIKQAFEYNVKRKEVYDIRKKYMTIAYKFLSQERLKYIYYIFGKWGYFEKIVKGRSKYAYKILEKKNMVLYFCAIIISMFVFGISPVFYDKEGKFGEWAQLTMPILLIVPILICLINIYYQHIKNVDLLSYKDQENIKKKINEIIIFMICFTYIFINLYLDIDIAMSNFMLLPILGKEIYDSHQNIKYRNNENSIYSTIVDILGVIRGTLRVMALLLLPLCIKYRYKDFAVKVLFFITLACIGLSIKKKMFYFALISIFIINTTSLSAFWFIMDERGVNWDVLCFCIINIFSLVMLLGLTAYWLNKNRVIAKYKDYKGNEELNDPY